MESSHCSSTEPSASAEPTSQQSEVLTRVFSMLKAAASTNDSSHDVTRSSSLEQHFVCCLKCKSATEQCKDLNKIGIFNFFSFVFHKFTHRGIAFKNTILVDCVPLRLLAFFIAADDSIFTWFESTHKYCLLFCVFHFDLRLWDHFQGFNRARILVGKLRCTKERWKLKRGSRYTRRRLSRTFAFTHCWFVWLADAN